MVPGLRSKRDVIRTNAIFTIYPYMKEGIWMFDDKSVGVKEEAFVSGADDIITAITNTVGIDNPKKGFVLQFSNNPFPGHIIEMNYLRKDLGGTWYRAYLGAMAMDGWLCGVLNLYYPTSPRKLYVRVSNKKE